MARPTNLFEEFNPTTKEAWLEKVAKDLKGKPLEDLQWHLNEKITLSPFAHADDLPEPPAPMPKSAETNDWEIGEELQVDEPRRANKLLLNILQNGVQAPRFILKKALDKDEVEVLFNEVILPFISIHFAGLEEGQAADVLVKALEAAELENKIDPGSVKGSLRLPVQQAVPKLKDWGQRLPAFRFLAIDGQDLARGSEGVVEELAGLVQRGLEAMDLGQEHGLSPETINDQLHFSCYLSTSYFVEIAKLRAFRLLWANVQKAYEIPHASMPEVVAHIDPATQTDDPNTNMIRTTTQAMSAVIAGVDRLYLLPAKAQEGDPTDFSRRIARNVQHLLKMESYLDRVLDPAAGSYYIEQLTQKLAEEAWKLMGVSQKER